MARQEAKGKSEEGLGGLGDFTFLCTDWFYCVHLVRHFIENMEIIVYNPCPVRVLLSSILNYHKRDTRASFIIAVDI
jgi:hypothetical protein